MGQYRVPGPQYSYSDTASISKGYQEEKSYENLEEKVIYQELRPSERE